MLKKKLQTNKGFSLLTLSIAVLIMIIITGMLVYRTSEGIRTSKLNNMYHDINILKEKVSIYYAQYGKLPLTDLYTDTDTITKNADIMDPNDNNKYYKIDLEALKSLTLNYGKGYQEDNSKDVYIINEQSQTIYYVSGIELDGKTYYRLPGEYTSVTWKERYPGKPDENGFFTQNSTINGKTVSYDNPIIPRGFKPVSTVEDRTITTNWNTATATQSESKEGLVIQDDQGNQFVWIPVENINKFKRTEGYSNGTLQALLSDCGEADGTGTNTKVTESATTGAEAKAMYASISTNKGFYIARFEAGKETINSVEKVVSKKDAVVWNNIGWSNSDAMNVETGGAVEKARGMYTDKTKYGVTSTLCYGVQWDSILNFIDSNYITKELDGKPNCAADSYLVNSTGKGNYTGNLVNTGDSNNYLIKNIYDITGNVREWTMESYSTNRRVGRGGNYNRTGIDAPSSFRGNNTPNFVDANIGFRCALYL